MRFAFHQINPREAWEVSMALQHPSTLAIKLRQLSSKSTAKSVNQSALILLR